MMYKMQLSLVTGPLVPHEIYSHGSTRDMYGQHANIRKERHSSNLSYSLDTFLPLYLVHCIRPYTKLRHVRFIRYACRTSSISISHESHQHVQIVRTNCNISFVTEYAQINKLIKRNK